MRDQNIDLEGLEHLTTNELCDRYQHLFGEPVRTRHKGYLVRKIAWRLQSLAQGDLTERARQRAAVLANDADVRVMAPKPASNATGANDAATTRVLAAPVTTAPDPRLPNVGTAIVRSYKGRTIRVIVHADGFEHEGERYKTLTAVAEKVTGSHINGYRFFRLESKP